MPETIFLRVLDADDKAAALRSALHDPHAAAEGRWFEVDPGAFESVPGAPFAYWAGDHARRLFSTYSALEQSDRQARLGASTKNDFRYLRLVWELDQRVSRQPTGGWQLFAKGGAYSPFYSALTLRVWWDRNAHELEAELLAKYPYLGANAEFVLHRNNPYKRPGLTWPLRTTSVLSVRVMPAGCIFGDKGPAVFVDNDDTTSLMALLAVTNSAAFRALVELQLAAADAAARSYEVGVIQRTPVPDLSPADEAALATLARRAWSLKRSLDTRTETSHAFLLPALLQVEGPTLGARAGAWGARVAAAEGELAAIQAEIDARCLALYGLTEDDLTIGDGAAADEDAGEPDEDEDEEVEEVEAGPMVGSLLSWALGVAFGRFDVRLATGDREPPPEPDPFDPLPAYSPGMLPDGEVPDDYPLALDPDGILVDDEGHPDDIIAKVREVLGLVWPDTADAIEAEACELLAVDSLRAWFANATGGFWDEHIKRYSKSRRKAPIWWMLAGGRGSRERSYAVWLSYHRFDRDTLYKVLNDYAIPKRKHEELRLESLREEAGDAPTAAQRKAMEAQASFVDELRAFEAELARVAPLWNPNLNDGVILNFAPLWRLVPQHRSWQRECRKHWDKLVAGEYDWAHLAMHLWPERVVPKCAEDRSLAIAHGLEAVFWREDDGAWHAVEVSPAEQAKLIEARTIPAVKEAVAWLVGQG